MILSKLRQTKSFLEISAEQEFSFKLEFKFGPFKKFEFTIIGYATEVGRMLSLQRAQVVDLVV